MPSDFADHLLGLDPLVELLLGHKARAPAPRPSASCLPCAPSSRSARPCRSRCADSAPSPASAIRSCSCSMRSLFGSMPTAQLLVEALRAVGQQPDALAGNCATIIGRNTFSSKLPVAPPKFTATSLPNTWQQSIVTASDCVGLTLPGMIELPGSFSGMLVRRGRSAGRSPASGRRWRSSSAPRRASSARHARATSASAAASASNLFGAVSKGRPVSFAELGRDLHRELRMRIQAGADRRAAQRQLDTDAAAAPRRAGCHGRAARHSRRIPVRASTASRPANACGRS